MSQKGTTTFAILIFVLTLFMGVLTWEGTRVSDRVDQHERAITELRGMEKKVQAIQKGVNMLCHKAGLEVPTE